MNIYVGNLPYSTDDRELQSEFEQFGQVARAQVIMDRDTGRSKGFGFVEMPEDSEARKAIEELNGKEMGGRPLRVNEAQPKPERRGGSGGPRRGGGGPRRESSY
jgi:RNA recognition motif-containing protein